LNKLKRKIFKFTVVILTVLFIGFLLLVFYFDKTELENKFNAEVEWLTQAIIMSSREPFWNYDEKTLRENMQTFLSVESVSRIIIRDNSDYLQIDLGETPMGENGFRVHESILFDDKPLGDLTIFFSKKVLQQNITENLFELIGQILLLFFLFFVLIAFISRKYAEPLTNLAKTIKKFNIRDPESYAYIWENTDVEEIQQVVKSYKEMAEEITANYQELEATNETLTSMNEELEKKSAENQEMADKLSKIIEISSIFDEAPQMDNQYFMKLLFKNAFLIIPEADYGTVYLYDDQYVLFLDSVGHDLSTLQKTHIPKEIFIKGTEKVGIIKNIFGYTAQRITERVKKQTPDIDLLDQATKAHKETLFFELEIGDIPQGGISLDIAFESEQTFTKESLESMKAFRSMASAFYKIQRYSAMQETFTKEIIISIVKMLEIHDVYTKGHSENVANMALALSQELKLSPSDCKQAYWSGLVHDIGKILIPDAILNKAGKLTSEEYEIIKMHPVWGYETLKNSGHLKAIAKIVLHHHERYDGKGYPNQVKGNDIPEISRIITIVDSWDAMCSKRSYKAPLSLEAALQELRDHSGEQFDPVLVEPFIKMMEENRGKIDQNGKFNIPSFPNEND